MNYSLTPELQARIKKAILDLGLWFMFGMVLTMGLAKYVPGKPIVVGTDSIPAGVYWLDESRGPEIGGYATFYLRDMPSWLRIRLAEHSENRVHTKMIIGGPGSIATQTGEMLQVCDAAREHCVSAGKMRTVDAKGAPLHSWLKQHNFSYTLKQGEYWVFGTNPRSLDSRFHGPVQRKDFVGQARPLLIVSNPS